MHRQYLSVASDRQQLFQTVPWHQVFKFKNLIFVVPSLKFNQL